MSSTELLKKVLSWLETQHTLECEAQAETAYTPTCKCDFWERAVSDFDDRPPNNK